ILLVRFFDQAVTVQRSPCRLRSRLTREIGSREVEFCGSHQVRPMFWKSRRAVPLSPSAMGCMYIAPAFTVSRETSGAWFPRTVGSAIFVIWLSVYPYPAYTCR